MELKTKRILISENREEAIDLIESGYIPFAVLDQRGTCSGVPIDPEEVYIYFYLPKHIKRTNKDIDYC